VNFPVLLLLAALHATLLSTDSRFHVEHSKGDFGMRSHGIIETLGPNHRNFYPLPQSTANQYIRLRPYDLRLNPLTPDKYERSEVIGPYQIDDGKIWFGNNYYDGEAMRGVGALAISIGQPADTLFSLPPK